MNRLSRSFSIGLGLLSLVVASSGPLYATPFVHHFFPYQGPAGTPINVFGSGFTGTTKVLFNPTNNLSSASFTVVNDTLLRVIAPPRDINDPLDQSMLVFVGDTATLALADDAHQIIFPGGSYDGLTNYFVINSGASMTGGGGHALMYVKSGGTFNDTGGGNREAVIEVGAHYHGSSSGSSRIYYEVGADVSLIAGGSITSTALNDVTLSVVPRFYTYASTVVPEPASGVLLAAGVIGIWAVVPRRHRTRV
jgi:hypothetical protein